MVDLVFIAFLDAQYTPSSRDALVRRINAARRHGVQLLLAMVALPARRDAIWAVDTPAVPAYLELVKREVHDVQFRFRSNVERDPVVGFYQTHEMLVSNSSFWVEQYQFYDAMAKAVHSVAPDLAVVLSPYWDVNRGSAGGLGLEATMAGLMAMAMTDIDVLVPQEGRGTGKAGVYTQDEENSRIADIDPNLARYANVNASSTFAQQFFASTPQLYRESGQVVKRANRLRPQNRPLKLWMNLEAFEHTSINPCDIEHDTDRTNATRVRRSWDLVRSCECIDSLISFMWDPYFECVPPGYNRSLDQELLGEGKTMY